MPRALVGNGKGKMAEGIVEGLIGGEPEKPETEGVQALGGAETFASAIAAKLAGSDPEVARETSAFLRKQAQLLATQNKLLEDEHALRLVNLRHQSHLLRGQRVGQALRIGFQLFVAAVATTLGIIGAIAIHDAINSRNVVVDPFEVPASLAGHGITGTVAASAVLDELTRMKDVTRSDPTVKRDVSGAWSNEVKLAVPETGISIAELTSILKARFGHDLHISGDLVEARNADLKLTVRGSNISPMTIEGPAESFALLTRQAAEYMYSKSQPQQWAAYLGNIGRFDEQIAFCESSYSSSSVADRPYLLNEWGRALERTGHPRAEALTLYRAAAELKPDLWFAYHHMMNAMIGMGDEEGAWRVGKHMFELNGGKRDPASPRAYDNWDLLTWDAKAWLSSVEADERAGSGVGTSGDKVGAEIVTVQAFLHDVDNTELTLRTSPEDPKEPIIAAAKHFARGLLASERGDSVSAANEFKVFREAYQDPKVYATTVNLICYAAPAAEAAGHPDETDAILSTAGRYVDCYRFRADILDGRGDPAGAQKAYADAVALAPDLPAAYYSWGVALLRHGNLAAAEEKLKAANERGPHWADPLKAWGDVLAKQGNISGAQAKYDEALRYAPKWKQLKEAREAVAKQKT